MRPVGLVFVAWMLSACASAPADPSLDAEAKQYRAPADKACIYVVPSSGTPSVAISMDGRKVATLSVEQYLRLDVAPGRHVLDVTRASALPAVLRTTREVTVDTEAGHCYFLRTALPVSGEEWREFRVRLERMNEDEGQRAVNVRWRAVP
jgi:hypothetical protein